MQLKVTLLIVVVYFITITSQKKDQTEYDFDKKKCADINIRIKLLDFFVKINQFFRWLPLQPIKLKLCDQSTTTTSTTPTTTTTTTTTTITTIPPNTNTSITTTSSTTTTTTTTTTICTSPITLVTLYGLFNPSSGDYFYTASASEAAGAVTTYGYMDQSSPGMVATSANDCLCGTTLEPIYRLRNGGFHFFTASAAEVTSAMTMYGYISEGIGFYCSSQLGYCGATLPLYRYQVGGGHFYTTNLAAAIGNYEGITCYIWP